MKKSVKNFSQYLKEDMHRRESLHQAAVVFDHASGTLEIMFGNFMHDYRGLEDAAAEGNEVHIVEYDPEDGGIYVINGNLDLSGVNVLKSF